MKTEEEIRRAYAMLEKYEKLNEAFYPEQVEEMRVLRAYNDIGKIVLAWVLKIDCGFDEVMAAGEEACQRLAAKEN